MSIPPELTCLFQWTNQEAEEEPRWDLPAMSMCEKEVSGISL